MSVTSNPFCKAAPPPKKRARSVDRWGLFFFCFFGLAHPQECNFFKCHLSLKKQVESIKVSYFIHVKKKKHTYTTFFFGGGGKQVYFMPPKEGSRACFLQGRCCLGGERRVTYRSAQQKKVQGQRSRQVK